MTVTLHYTEAILRQAILDFLRRAYLKRLILPSMVLLVAIGLALCSDSPWLKVFVVVPCVVLPAMFGLAYWLRIEESLKRLKMLDQGQLILTVNDSGVFSQSAVSKSETPWKIYNDLWEFPDSYILFYGSSQFITLPRNQVTPEFVEFIRSKVIPGKSTA